MPEPETKFTTLRIDVPKNNDKAPLAAEQMFASIHGIYSEGAPFQERLSFEIVARDKFIQFYVHMPLEIKDFVEGQIYAQYPAVEIQEVPDYIRNVDADKINFATCELEMTKPDVYPIKLFSDFEVDPISGITSVMSKLGAGEEVWLQLVIRPVGDEWQEKGNKIIEAVRAGKTGAKPGLVTVALMNTAKFAKMVFLQAIKPGSEFPEEAKKEIKLAGTVEEALKSVEYKIVKLGFETKLRLVSVSNDPASARIKCQNVAAAFKQYNTTNLNGFKIREIIANNKEAFQAFAERDFSTAGYILNISELASIFHLPHQTVATPNIVWSGSKKGEPPANLPTRENTADKELTVVGETNFRNTYKLFGIRKDDRRRHVYMVGKSGTGKSTLIENMAIDDVVENRGLIIVDPHGELAEKVLACIPDDRVNDVVVFDPSDRAHPIAFNLLEHVDDDFKGMVASGFVGIFKKIFGDSWGPRLEHILRNTVLALLDYPESTMLDIPRMLTDSHFRDKVVERVKDAVIKEFWINEFAQYDSKFRTEAVSPILNKVGQFLSTATIRNIVGQPYSKINIREVMDQEKIMIVNLSRGKIGEDNSALLGAMMITKIQLAAMSRADVTVDKRPDTYLYVDEFQNFATDSFATILSEARKYNLCLTMAHQYVEQMPEEVRSAVFGNAGTLVSFRVGASDADLLVKEYEPIFEANDLVNLDKYHIYIKLLIDGISAPAFSARTLPPIQRLSGNAEKVIEISRWNHSTNRITVEEMIANRAKQDEEEARAEAEAFKKGGLEAVLLRRGAQPAEPAIPDKKIESYKKASSLVEQPSKEATTPAATGPVFAPELPEQGSATLPESDRETEDGAGEPEETKNKKKARVFRYQNIIGDKIYKEQTTRGGVKWFVGEPIDTDQIGESGIPVNEDGRKMIELAAKAAGKAFMPENLSQSGGEPALKKPVEEVSNIEPEIIQKSKPGTSADALDLKEGEEIKLEQ